MTALPAAALVELRAVVEAVADPDVTLSATPSAPSAAVAPPTHIARPDAVVIPLVRPGRRAVNTAPVERRASVGGVDGVPCAARPSTGFRHLDGACRCFVGGPPPVFPTTADPAAHS